MTLLATLALSAGLALAGPTTQPTMVKLYIEAQDPAESARQITRQLGLAVRLAPNSGPMQVDGGGSKTFVQSLAELFKQGEVVPGPAPGRGSIQLSHGTAAFIAPVSDTALLVVQGINVNARRGLIPQYQSPQNYTYTLKGVLFFDPALRILGVLNEARADRVDADGAVLPPDNSPGNQMYQIANALNSGQPRGQVAIRFASSTQLTQITGLTAQVKAIQVTEEASLDIAVDATTGGKAVEGQGLTGTLSTGENQGNRAMVTVKLSGPAIVKYRGGQWMQSLPRFVTMQDVNGETLAVDALGAQPDPDGKSVSLRFRPTNNNTSFFDELAVVSVRVPTKVSVIDFPIELKGMDLKVK